MVKKGRSSSKLGIDEVDTRRQTANSPHSQNSLYLLDTLNETHLKQRWKNHFYRDPSGVRRKPPHSPVDDQFVTSDIVWDYKNSESKNKAACFMRAGPRSTVVFKPENVRACIVSCGGLCPGLNNIIEEIVRALWFNYSVDEIYGIRWGYRGFYLPTRRKWPFVKLTPERVQNINKLGGSILGSSRGGFDLEKIVEAIEHFGFNQVYIIGGDGTHKGALRIAQRVKELNLKVAVVGLPKTIDNDIAVIDRSFGFRTAVEQAVKAVKAAEVEAYSQLNCVGLVRLMGRDAGFVAAHTALASGSCDMCIVPEVKCDLKNVLSTVEECCYLSGTCVIVVAEGAAKHFVESSGKSDASGNKVIPDVGAFLKKEILAHLKKVGLDPCSVKYIDPSYMIRSVPANAFDALSTLVMAHNAVHGAFAGYTAFSSGIVNNKSVYIPMQVIVGSKHVSLNPKGRTWERVQLVLRNKRKGPKL